MSWVLLLVSIVSIWASLQFEGGVSGLFDFELSPSAALFPIICALVCGCSALILAIKKPLPALRLKALHELRLPMLIIVVSFLYVVLMLLIGFIVSTLLFVPLLAFLLSYKKYSITLITTLCWSFGAYAVFVLFLKVPL